MGYEEYLNRRRNYYLGIIVLFVLGGLILLLIILEPVDISQKIKSILSPIGAGLVATGLTRFVQSQQVLRSAKQDEIQDVVENWGLLGIQEGRGREEQQRYSEQMLRAEDKIHIQAISLSRFREDLEEEINRADSYGVEIKLLLLDPDSEICERYEELTSTREDISGAIRASIQEFEEMNLDNVELRYYDDIPVNYFRVDNQAFFGPYFGRRRSSSTITFLGEADGGMIEQFEENFNDCWEAADSV
jgi:hypothetical protein